MTKDQTEEPMNMNNDRVVKFVATVDGTEFVVPAAAARLCELAANVMGEDDDDNNEEDNHEPVVIEIARASSQVLSIIVDFLKLHHKNPMPAVPEPPFRDHSFKTIMTHEAYQDFVDESNMELQQLFDVYQAANYMNIPPLLDLICLKLTFDHFNKKTPEEFREMLKLPAMTEEEEATAREEYPWLFETE